MALNSFPKAANLRFVQCDLRNGQRLTQLLAKYEPSHIFHLGAQSLPTVSWADAVGTFESNVMGSLYLFEAVRHMKRPPSRGIGLLKCRIWACSPIGHTGQGRAGTSTSSPVRHQ